ncbi:MAG: FHA domain-containing protein [Candidatus Promineifilaceae bacterium]
MSPPVFLLILRLTGALLLLCFLGVIAWFIYRDIQLVTMQTGYQAKPQGTLQVLSSDTDTVEDGEEFSLSMVNSIGRAPVNVIVLDDEFTSSRHALVTWSGEQWMVEDVGSRNGTLLNDLPVDSQTVMVSGDILTVGQTRFRLDS